MYSLSARAIVALLIIALAVASGQSAAVGAAATLDVLAAVGGQPDDITAAGNALIWGDLAHGTIDRLAHGRITTIARGLSVPEGIIVLPDRGIAVAEQGRDRVVRIAPNGRRTVLLALRPVAGQEGVDGIGWNARTDELLIPDSPRGTLLALRLKNRRVRTIATGLGRPVDAAVDTRGDILVPDEQLGTLVVVAPNGQVSRRGRLATPDDVAVARSGRIWITTLGDGGLWTIDPGATALRRVLSGLADPQGLTLDRCGDPIVVDQNTARIARLLVTSTAHCTL